MVEWHNKNILKIGNENKLVINILDASITKNEIENVDAKKYEEKTIYKYELFFLVEYELYDRQWFFNSKYNCSNFKIYNISKIYFFK